MSHTLTKSMLAVGLSATVLLTGQGIASATKQGVSGNPTVSAAAAVEAQTRNSSAGTWIDFLNDSDHSVWVRSYLGNMDWSSADELKPGQTRSYHGRSVGSDDVEMRVYRSEDDAYHDKRRNRVDIDGENPIYSSPWLSVDQNSEYFSVNGTYTWHARGDSKFWGKREADSVHYGSTYKTFQLHLKRGVSPVACGGKPKRKVANRGDICGLVKPHRHKRA